MREQLAQTEIDDFHRDGFVLIRGFYDVDTEIRPIQAAIAEIIALVRASHGLPVTAPDSVAHFDHQFADLIAHDRRLGGVVYDAIKQIPAFVRLVCSTGHEAVFRQLRKTDLAGIAAGGYGIRIDNPGEESFRADWHQEYPAQLRSVDGAVFWSPLVPIRAEMGPVRVGIGSHADGLVPVLTRDPDHPDKAGAYALILSDRAARVARYPEVAPLTNPGDLLIMDFLTLHASGHNVSDRSRWSMQSRLFNFKEPKGIAHGWSGSYAAGTDFRKIHPELVAD
jgi:hypothetical protein